MSQPSVLLVQVRLESDPMATHELACIRRRLSDCSLELHRVNAFDDSWEPSEVDAKVAVLVGGSGDFSVHDPRSRPWVLRLRRVLDRVLEREVPAFGLCFGHQLLGYHLGAEVRTDTAHAELGTTSVKLTEEGKSDPLFGLLESEFPVHTGHSDFVVDLPEELERMAENERLSNQAFRLRGQLVYSTQFHPDLNGAEATERYLAYKHNLLTPSNPDASPFREGADSSTSLLGSFCKLASQR